MAHRGRVGVDRGELLDPRRLRLVRRPLGGREGLAAEEDRPGFVHRLCFQLQLRRHPVRHVDPLPALLGLGRAAAEYRRTVGDSGPDVLVWGVYAGGRGLRRCPLSDSRPIEAFDAVLHLPFPDTFWLGVVLLLVAVGYVAISALHRKPFRFFRWQIPLPPLKLTLYQIAIACGDLLVAAAVLYALLPPIEGGYLRVLGIFMLAFVVGVLTHVPGGYGVFDGLILHILPQPARPAVFAASSCFG